VRLHPCHQLPPTVFGRGDPARAVALFNRVARAGAKKAAPDLYTYGTIIRCSDAGQLNLVSLPSGRSSRRDGGCKPSPSINCSRASVQGRMWTIMIHGMPQMGCTPDIYLQMQHSSKMMCDVKRNQEALHILHMMADDEVCRLIWSHITLSLTVVR
jgi:hypothetical protein